MEKEDVREKKSRFNINKWEGHLIFSHILWGAV